MADSGRRPIRRLRLKGWYVALAVIAVLVGLIAVHVLFAKGRLDRRLDALRSAGYPTTLAELVEYNKLPQGSPNAADVYTRAFALHATLLDETNVPYLGSGQWPDRGQPLPESMSKAISQCLADNQQRLSLLHEAAGIEDCDYDRNWRQPATTGFQQVAAMRHCIYLLGLGATYYSHTGDPNTAMRCIEDGLRLASSLRRDPVLINYLVRLACISLMVQSLDRSLNAAVFTDRQLAQLEETLTATAGTLDLTQALITQRCIMIEMCRELPVTPGSSPGPQPRTHPSVMRTAIVDILGYMDDYIEASKRPPLERLARFRAVAQEVEGLSVLHALTKTVFGPTVGRTAEMDLRAHASIALARTALAIERYRLATGKVPERLEELVPRYLKEVPIDPFGGQPIRYRRTDPGYLLYSVNDDGQDNSGKEKAEVTRGDPYDWPFIMTR